MRTFTFNEEDRKYIVSEIDKFMSSDKRKQMLDGDRYFRGEHDILKRERKMISKDGTTIILTNLPNNKVIDNQYKKMVNQKTNYLLGQPLTIQTEVEQYYQSLKQLINKNFLRRLKNVGRDSLNCGIAWLFLHYDDYGNLNFRRLKPVEVIAGWKDDERTILDYAIRVYEVYERKDDKEELVRKVEVYHADGLARFDYNDGKMIQTENKSYFTVIDNEKEWAFNWSRIPLIPFKFNSEEIPLIVNVKSLQDGLNSILSTFQNNMEEDARNTILVLVNYDGENLEDFRKNLAAYGAVKINTVDGRAGDVRTLQVEVNAENYQAILQIFKKAIIENAMGYDAKDDRLSGHGQANQLNIMSMYSDIDLDANEMETEYQASFEQLLFFFDLHLANTGVGDFDGEDVDIIFNRDMLISESSVIEDLRNSVGILSTETLIAHHPWVDDVQKELELLKAEKAESELYQGTFGLNDETSDDSYADE